MNLYRVTCKGMTGGNPAHGLGYVLAENAGDAYKKMRAALDKADVGSDRDRALDKIELLAEEGEYPECGFALHR